MSDSPVSCLRCGSPAEGRGPAPICRLCEAEMALTGEVRLEQPKSSFSLTSKCGICGKFESYNPTHVKRSWVCDKCEKTGCNECMALCVHQELGTKVLCKLCRAEYSLTGQPVLEATKELPKTDKEDPRRELYPHCGEATCVNDPKAEGRPWCECECDKCKAAVGAGYVEPMKVIK